MTKVFLSYSKGDSDIASRVSDQLKENHFDVFEWCFGEQSIKAPNASPQIIKKEVEEAELFLVIFSTNPIKSKYATEVFETAFDKSRQLAKEKRKFIYIIKVGDLDTEAIDTKLGQLIRSQKGRPNWRHYCELVGEDQLRNLVNLLGRPEDHFRSSDKNFDIFISYSSRDDKIVRRLTNSLSKYGIKTWIDYSHLKAGEDWQVQIRDAIFNSNLCLIVLTKNSDPLKSRISREWSTIQECTWDREDLSVLPIEVDRVETPQFLRGKQRLYLNSQDQLTFDRVAKQVYRMLLEISQGKKAKKDEETHRDLIGKNKRFVEIIEAINETKEDMQD